MSSDIAFASSSSAPMAELGMSSLMPVPTSAAASELTTPRLKRAAGSATSCASSMPTCRSLPVPHDLTTSRARARAARLRANEAAERREDMAALITTPAQWAVLRRSFASVKTEFTDLDGMSWNVPVPVPVPTPPSIGTGSPSSRSVFGSVSVPVLALDEGTVRPGKGRKRRLSAVVPGWGQAVRSDETGMRTKRRDVWMSTFQRSEMLSHVTSHCTETI
ncbi:hypothetical protein F5148DRAFT_1174798 [Russula earlei]|uniref:Uncharacterized protein n=1 Tax=Russula earlei TaxID=71964 RepID=A0ACC0UHH4_9AGAM|nr:hypothetical protein F5148DRAFT_1174798 [Russula earlei]